MHGRGHGKVRHAQRAPLDLSKVHKPVCAYRDRGDTP
jgi:hypothetical protein